MIFHIDDPGRAADTAIVDAADDRVWSFGELAAAIRAFQAELPGGKKLLFAFCRNRIESILWYLAAFDGGHSVALLDDTLNDEFKTRLISQYRPELIASGSSPGPDYHRISERNLWQRTVPEAEDAGLHPDLAILLATSGTTGHPRLVRLTRQNVEANARSICEALGIVSADRAAANLPIHYSYGFSVVNTHLLAGAMLLLIEEGLLSGNFWDFLRRHSCTSLAGVPYTYQVLRRLDLEKLDVPSIRTCTQAGGKLENGLIAHFHGLLTARGGRFFVMYGQTEAAPRIAILPSESLPEKPGSVGLPVPGGSFSIQDSGELLYSGPNVMMGYAINRSDLAKGDELGGLLATGDTAQIDADGYLYILGRTGREAKLYGLRLNLDEIENLLRHHGPTAVVAARDRLLIFCEYGDAETYRRYARELAETLHINLGAFVFHGVDKIPVNSRGKVDYQKLAAQ